MTRIQKANYLRMTLGIQGIEISHEIAYLTIKNLEAIERRKGDLTLDEILRIKK